MPILREKVNIAELRLHLEAELRLHLKAEWIEFRGRIENGIGFRT